MPVADLMPIGGLVEKLIRIEESGGTCTEPGCAADAPFVVLGEGRAKVPLPCEAHAVSVPDPEDELTAELAVGALAASGLTERMDAFTFESYRRRFRDDGATDALAFAQDWLADYVAGVRRNALVWGTVGCGKTGLAAAMVRDLCERGIRARYVDFAALLDAMREAIGHKQPVGQALAVGRTPVLVLDDLGSEQTTEWAVAQLLAIVNERYEKQLPTIYISNYGPKELKAKLGKFDPIVGERIVTRMLEGAVRFDYSAGRNRRQRAA